MLFFAKVLERLVSGRDWYLLLLPLARRAGSFLRHFAPPHPSAHFCPLCDGWPIQIFQNSMVRLIRVVFHLYIVFFPMPAAACLLVKGPFVPPSHASTPRFLFFRVLRPVNLRFGHALSENFRLVEGFDN